ncbi:hypothetical protein ACU610_18980 [Geodermatophilus sp. URMC 61]|uniref:hypothetical protein n=1 Tax=Geodermatophilus sp. URMC 61 TaxID=3423411 RepID=UPI00406C1E7B
MPPSVLSVVRVQADGRVLAEAEIRRTEVPGVVASAMHVESGHLPVGTGTRLVDAVLEQARLGEAELLVATMPINDTEMLDRVRQRSGEVAARAAGATKIVEARLVPAPR